MDKETGSLSASLTHTRLLWVHVKMTIDTTYGGFDTSTDAQGSYDQPP